MRMREGMSAIFALDFTCSTHRSISKPATIQWKTCAAWLMALEEEELWNSWIKGVAKVKFPEGGNPEDYRFEAVSKEWVHWDNWVQPYEPLAGVDTMYQNIVVSGADIEKYKYVLDLNVQRTLQYRLFEC